MMEPWEREFDRPGEYNGPAGFAECRRGQMPAGTRLIDDDEFLEQLEAFDPDVDILFDSRRGTWAVYRVKRYGACAADDLLIHEFDLPADPGFWVLNELRRRSIVRPGETSSDPKIAAREFIKKLRDGQRVRKERRHQEWLDFMVDIRKQMDTYLVRNRRGDGGTWAGKKKKKHADIESHTQRSRVTVKFDERTGLLLPEAT